jgi:hypothetical protein
MESDKRMGVLGDGRYAESRKYYLTPNPNPYCVAGGWPNWSRR